MWTPSKSNVRMASTYSEVIQACQPGFDGSNKKSLSPGFWALKSSESCDTAFGCVNMPQEGSIGLVVEAARPNELDGFEWYCFECQALVHRVEVKVQHLVKDLPPLYEAFYADKQARKCKTCGAIHPGKKPPAGWVKI